MKFFVLIISLIFSSSVLAENYVERYERGLEKSFSQPVLLGALVPIAALNIFDDDVQQQCNGRYFTPHMSKIFDLYGHGANYIVASTYILGEGLVNDRTRDEYWKNLRSFNEAYVTNAVMTLAIKKMTNRERPGKQNFNSFPSGHTSTSFVTAAFLNKVYDEKIGVPAFCLAALTGYQRIYDNHHWLTDVLAGAVLGTLIGNGFGQLRAEELDKTSLPPVTISYSITF